MHHIGAGIHGGILALHKELLSIVPTNTPNNAEQSLTLCLHTYLANISCKTFWQEQYAFTRKK